MDVINRIENWFSVAVPEPSPDAWQPQLAVHIEEFTEMLVDGLGLPVDCSVMTELKEVENYYRGNGDPEHPNDIMLLDSLADQIVTAIGVAKMRGYDIFGALKEVAQSNESKFYYVGKRELPDFDKMDLDFLCKEIESQGRYEGVQWERHGEWVVFKDENGKIMKNPRTYREPELGSFIGEK